MDTVKSPVVNWFTIQFYTLWAKGHSTYATNQDSTARNITVYGSPPGVPGVSKDAPGSNKHAI